MKKKEAIQWINNAISEISFLEKEIGRSILEGCGRKCARSHGLPHEAEKIREAVDDKNNIDLLFKTYKEQIYNNSPRLYKKGNIIYLEYHNCGCPLVNSGQIKNSIYCNCTRGYTKQIYETLFGKLVEVKLLQSMLKGDKICKQEITFT